MKKLIMTALTLLFVPTVAWGAEDRPCEMQKERFVAADTPIDHWQAYVDARVKRARRDIAADAHTDFMKSLREPRVSLTRTAPKPVVSVKMATRLDTSRLEPELRLPEPILKPKPVAPRI